MAQADNVRSDLLSDEENQIVFTVIGQRRQVRKENDDFVQYCELGILLFFFFRQRPLQSLKCFTHTLIPTNGRSLGLVLSVL